MIYYRDKTVWQGKLFWWKYHGSIWNQIAYIYNIQGMYDILRHNLNVPDDAIDHVSSFYFSKTRWIWSFGKSYLDNNVTYL